MKKIAIIGAGPTGIYTLFSLLKQGEPLDVSIYEQAEEAGVGMPYSDEENSRMMLANIASIEIPHSEHLSRLAESPEPDAPCALWRGLRRFARSSIFTAHPAG